LNPRIISAVYDEIGIGYTMLLLRTSQVWWLSQSNFWFRVQSAFRNSVTFCQKSIPVSLTFWVTLCGLRG
jgi:hypothetical protein